jgi:hypothetical protein
VSLGHFDKKQKDLCKFGALIFLLPSGEMSVPPRKALLESLSNLQEHIQVILIILPCLGWPLCLVFLCLHGFFVVILKISQLKDEHPKTRDETPKQNPWHQLGSCPG